MFSNISFQVPSSDDIIEKYFDKYQSRIKNLIYNRPQCRDNNEIQSEVIYRQGGRPLAKVR